MKSEELVSLPVAVTINDSSGDNSDTKTNGSAGTSTNNGSGCQPSSSTEKFKPKYFVPNSFFVLKSEGTSQGYWLFACKRCFDKEINASYKYRVNLRTYVKKRLNGLLPTFDKLCQENDSRKSKKPETKAVTEPTSSEQSNVKSF